MITSLTISGWYPWVEDASIILDGPVSLVYGPPAAGRTSIARAVIAMQKAIHFDGHGMLPARQMPTAGGPDEDEKWGPGLPEVDITDELMSVKADYRIQWTKKLVAAENLNWYEKKGDRWSERPKQVFATHPLGTNAVELGRDFDKLPSMENVHAAYLPVAAKKDNTVASVLADLDGIIVLDELKAAKELDKWASRLADYLDDDDQQGGWKHFADLIGTDLGGEVTTSHLMYKLVHEGARLAVNTPVFDLTPCPRLEMMNKAHDGPGKNPVIVNAAPRLFRSAELTTTQLGLAFDDLVETLVWLGNFVIVDNLGALSGEHGARLLVKRLAKASGRLLAMPRTVAPVLDPPDKALVSAKHVWICKSHALVRASVWPGWTQANTGRRLLAGYYQKTL